MNDGETGFGIEVENEIIFKGYIHEKIEDGFCANEGCDHRISYNGRMYEFSDLLGKYLEKDSDYELKEILPDIKMKYRELKKKWWKYRAYSGCEWEFRITLDTKLCIAVYLDTIPIGVEKSKVLWISSGEENIRIRKKELQTKRDKLGKNWDSNTHKVLQTIFKDVPVKDIVGYPDRLGKGTQGCIQLYNYMKGGLYNPIDELNSEMIINEILEISAKDEDKVKQCINSERCGWLYNEYCNGTLKQLKKYVALNEVDGKFYIGRNGNHRVCLLRRVKADTIYAEVSVWVSR
jgi:hypothetical protein